MTALHYRTASDVAGAIARGELSAVHVAEHALQRIGEINPRLNAVVALTEDEMFPAAGDVDLRTAKGPLAGVPVTIKEAINVAGLATTWGNPEWKDAVAATDAAVVSRLRTAGGLIAGKTNDAVMLADFGQTTNPLFGTTNNPWNPGRAAGGSSGGSAAAVAAGMSYLDFGSDLGGSIRIPAALCGVYGLKPTPGIVPLAGFEPPETSGATLLDDLCVLGPFARSAGDIRLALRCAAGPLPPASTAYHWSLPSPRHRRLTDFRVGLVLDDPDAPITSEVGAVLSNLIDALSARNIGIAEGWPAKFDPRTSHAAFAYMLDAYFAFKMGRAGPDKQLHDLIAHDQQRTTLQTIWDDYFGNVDVFVCPTTFTTAPAHDDRPFNERTITTPTGQRNYLDLQSWITHASIAGLPVLNIPAGLASDGLPVGLQVIAARYDDQTAITFAELLAEEITGYQPPRV
jgi:amidase